jgi:class 3 adenylate cyclase/tetratricopeptide (TPR) repeat protein
MRFEGAEQRRGETRRAAVLFVDLLGFSELSDRLGTEPAYLLVTQCVKALDGIARSQGGSVDKYLGDRLMAVFGHPIPLAQPSSAAVRAALEMREWLARYNAQAGRALPLGIHLGVNTGELVAGDIRGPVVREFHVLGDAVNVAARLNAKAAAGEIYVGQETWEETRHQLAYRAVEPLQLKGKSERVPAHLLVGEHDDLVIEGAAGAGEPGAADATVPLLGRDAELARLAARASALRSGQGAVVLLSGPEGIGKSRLLEAFAAEPSLVALSPVRARCRVGASPTRLAAALAALHPDPAEAGARVVLLDDAQWLQGAALDALSQLCQQTRTSPLLVVLALRNDPPEAAERIRAGLELWPEAEEIALTGLGTTAAARLLESLPGGSALDSDTRAVVEKRAAGNPGRLRMAVHLAPALRSEREHAARFETRSHESERRRMAILFADITGFTAMTERVGAESAYPVVAECLGIMDEVAKEFGGTVDHYLGDCVLALFGVPEALEDPSRSAINAAIEMRNRVRAFNEEHDLESPLDLHSGIATGAGIAGDISGPLIREFAVMGDHVDRAYTLADLAVAGEIFVDEETHRHAEAVFDFEPLVAVRGPNGRKLEPFRLSSRRVQHHRARLGGGRRVFSQLVGRAAELETLQKRVGRVARREQGGAISLVAEAGIGKSRLVAELRSSPEAEGVHWLEGRSISNGRNLSFHPFADLCRSWAGISDEDDDTGAGAKLEEAAIALLPRDEAAEALPFLKKLVGFSAQGEERERLELLQGDVLERLMRRAMQLLVTRLSEQRPTVLVMDDVHWADLSSIEMIELLLPLTRSDRLLFIHVQRPGYLETSERLLAFARREIAEGHLEVVLPPLDTRAARTLVANVFGAGDVPHATRQLIEEKAKGNPFYIEEVVRALLDAGAVELRNGSLHATGNLADFVVPGTVQDVIMARVDRLAPSKRRVLQFASVIGGTFHVSVLEALELAGEDLDAILDDLENAEFIVPDDRLQGREYAFKHPLMQEVTYEGLLETKRRELHLSVGEAIESGMSNEVPGFESMLAYHFTKARAGERAEVHLFRAGEEAARSAASGEALHFFREASRLYLETHGDQADPAKRALLARNIARALFNRGQLVEAQENFDAAIGLLGQPVPRSQAALVMRLAVRALPMIGRLYLGERLKRRPATEAEQEVIALMLERAMCETTVDPTRFVLDSLDTLATALRVDPSTVPAAPRVLAGASTIFSYGGLSFALSRRVLRTVQGLVAGSQIEGRVFYGVAGLVHHLFEGDWSPAHDLEDELIQEALDRGLLWDVLTYLGLHTEREIGKGNFGFARERIGRVQELWDRYGHDLARSTFQALGTYLALAEGRYADAIDAAETYYEENPELLLRLLALAGRGRAEARLGRLDAAEETLRRAAEIVHELGTAQVPPYQYSHYLCTRLVVDVARLREASASADSRAARARRSAARRTLRRALRVGARCALRRVEILRLGGTVEWLSGREGRARRSWATALEEAQNLGARPELARTHLEVAACLGAPHEGPLAGLTPAEHGEKGRSLSAELGLEITSGADAAT